MVGRSHPRIPADAADEGDSVAPSGAARSAAVLRAWRPVQSVMGTRRKRTNPQTAEIPSEVDGLDAVLWKQRPKLYCSSLRIIASRRPAARPSLEWGSPRLLSWVLRSAPLSRRRGKKTCRLALRRHCVPGLFRGVRRNSLAPGPSPPLGARRPVVKCGAGQPAGGRERPGRSST